MWTIIIGWNLCTSYNNPSILLILLDIYTKLMPVDPDKLK